MSAAQPDSNDLLARLPRFSDLHLHKLDLARQAVLAIEFSQQAYRAASFLDDRILTQATRGGWLPIGHVVDRAATIQQPQALHFIFHAGHVGSTLLSRLLDETGRVLSLREPLILRNLADAADVINEPESLLGADRFQAIMDAVLRCWSRGYPDTRCVVVKATSSASRLWNPMLAAGGRRAVWLNLRPEPYLATLLAGANSPLDLRGHAPGRMRRLQALTRAEVQPLHQLSLGELAALSWLVEAWTQRNACEQLGSTLLSLDFDELLSDVTGAMRQVVAHFGIPDCDAFLAGVRSSPVLGQYSKAANLPYSPQVRAQVLRESRIQNAPEIRAGMDWLERMADVEPKVAAIASGT